MHHIVCATYGDGCLVFHALYVFGRLASFAKMAEPTEMQFGGGQIGVSLIDPAFDVRAYWRHLANTIERFVCSCDTALCQIILCTCYCGYLSFEVQCLVTHRQVPIPVCTLHSFV